MTEWLVAECRVFGLVAQNWMLLVVGAFIAYAVAHALLRMRSRHPG
jgi:type IV secretory pathway TrbD component